VDFAVTRLGREKSAVSYKSGYSADSAHHAYLKQSHVRHILVRLCFSN